MTIEIKEIVIEEKYNNVRADKALSVIFDN